MNKKRKKIRKEHIVTYFFIFSILGVAIFGLYFLNVSMTGFAVYEQSNQSEFDEGVYNNTKYNGSAVVLAGSNLTGTYTSKVFDAGGDASWNNMSWVGNEPDVEFLYCVDGEGDVFKSSDVGVTWAMTKENYGRTSSTLDMFNDESSLYILTGTNKEVFKSTDFGVTWNIINDTFSTNSLLIGAVDFNNNLYVATGPGDVFKSTDKGITWNLLSDFNSGTNDAKGIAINSSDDIYIVDGAGDVYSSIDSGLNWTKINDGYGGTTGTDGIVVDSNNNLYILINSDVYSSTDSGLNWTKINDDFSLYSNDGMEIEIDSDDNLYIADGVGRIFKSTDSGLNWNEIGDCNNVASNNPKGLTNFVQNTNLSFEVKNCSSFDCSDGNWQEIDLNNLNLVSRYFQYKVSFTSLDPSYTPELYNMSIDYTILNTAPIISIIEPQNQLYISNEFLSLNYSVFDSDGNLDSCWYNIDGGANATLASCANTTFDVSGDGSYVLLIYANDSFGLESSDSVSFDVDSTGVSVSVTEPTGEKTVRAGIPITYTIIGDDLTCWYNVKTSIGGDVLANTTLENCSDSTFDVSIDGDYVLNLYVNNSFGSSDLDNSSFSVDTSEDPVIVIPPSSGGGGGSSGGSSSGESIIISGSNKLEISLISDLIVNPGDSNKLVLEVKNTGTNFLNNCRFIGKDEFSSWISSSEGLKNLAAGEKYSFSFDVIVLWTTTCKISFSSGGVFFANTTETGWLFVSKSFKRLKSNI